MATRKATKRPARKAASRQEPEYKSFRLAKNAPPFQTFKITRQTVYWIILLAFIIVTQLWILKIQLDIAKLTESLLVVTQ